MVIVDAERVLVGRSAPMLEVTSVDRTELQVAQVVDDRQRLLGPIGDGDVRRASLRGMTQNDHAETAMNSQPATATEGSTEAALEALMKRTLLRWIPVVHETGVLNGLTVPRSEVPVEEDEKLVGVMAGGLGTPLAELTKDRPKSLPSVGPNPTLEKTVERFVEHSFTQTLNYVNHESEMIKDYFGDGTRLGARSRYIHEDRRLGTVGGLQHIRPLSDTLFIVVNGDALTTVDYRTLFRYHAESGCTATIGISYHDVRFPYGVAQFSDHLVDSLVEKPVLATSSTPVSTYYVRPASTICLRETPST